MAKKILVVDDEPAQLRLVEQVLKSNGYQVVLAPCV
jgi:CheY-like chemotaxis protein